MTRDNQTETKQFAKLGLNGGENTNEHVPVQAEHLQVIVRGDNFDRALKAFRAIVQKVRVLSTYKERQSYEKPSVKRRRKQAESRRKAFEAENKEARMKKYRKQRETND